MLLSTVGCVWVTVVVVVDFGVDIDEMFGDGNGECGCGPGCGPGWPGEGPVRDGGIVVVVGAVVGVVPGIDGFCCGFVATLGAVVEVDFIVVVTAPGFVPLITLSSSSYFLVNFA